MKPLEGEDSVHKILPLLGSSCEPRDRKRLLGEVIGEPKAAAKDNIYLLCYCG